MSKTVSNLTLLDPYNEVFPGAFTEQEHIQHPLEAMNWELSNLRRTIHHEEFSVDNAEDGALWQGAGSAIDTTLNTKTHRLNFFYRCRAAADDLSIVTVVAVADRETANGTIDVEFVARDGSGGSVDAVSLTVSATTPTTYTGAVAGGATTLQNGTTYLGKVYLTAGAAGGSAIRVYRLHVFESAIFISDMPTGP